MRVIRLQSPNDFAEWRGHARRLLAAGLSPEQVEWRMLDDPCGLLDSADAAPLPQIDRPVGSVPRQFLDLAEQAICHADPARFSVLYQLLWRLQGDSQLLGDATARDNSLLNNWVYAVRRDSHKMKAFVRFKSIADDSGLERYAAWFEPDHYTLEMTAPFFARRFDGMIWAIVTPYRSAYWDGESLAFGPGGRRSDVPQDDAVEADWKTYFSSIFNPARLKVAMMKSEMPVKYWRNLPEAELIAPLIRNARQMEAEMIERATTQPPSRHVRRQTREAEMPEETEEISSLADARAAVQDCRRCPLHEHATQAVFGEGPEQADVMFVGEQPGDQEDLYGRPFVGPAGQVFDRALTEAGIDRADAYVTNAVKHFKYVQRGKRRLHRRPTAGEVKHYRWWLKQELDLVGPRIVVALGATALLALSGKTMAVGANRGPTRFDNRAGFVTVHPSYLLRLPDEAERERAYAMFRDDLERVRALAT